MGMLRRIRPRTLAFSLGVLLIAVTLGWCAKEAWRGHARHDLLTAIVEHGGDYQQRIGAAPKMSFVRQWCGDQCVVVIWLPPDRSGPSADEIRIEFPKAQILVAADIRP